MQKRTPDKFYKILKGLTRIYLSLFREVKEVRNEVRLIKALAESGKSQKHAFSSSCVIQKLNVLPTDQKTAPSLSSFKNRLNARIMRTSTSIGLLKKGQWARCYSITRKRSFLCKIHPNLDKILLVTHRIFRVNR